MSKELPELEIHFISENRAKRVLDAEGPASLEVVTRTNGVDGEVRDSARVHRFHQAVASHRNRTTITLTFDVDI